MGGHLPDYYYEPLVIGQENPIGRSYVRPKRQFGEIMTVIGFVNTMFSVGFGIYKRLDDPVSNEQLYEQMKEIEATLNNIQSELQDVTKAVKKECIQVQYLSAQRVVYESLRISIYYLNMTEHPELFPNYPPEFNVTQADLDYWEDEFAKWGSLLRENINFLMDGLLGRGILAGDILKTIVDISDVYN